MTDRAWRIVNDSSDVSGWMVFGFFEEIKVNAEEGIDHRACGMNERKCKTISFTKNVIDISKSTQIAILVDPSTYVEGSYSVDSARIEFGNTGGGTVTVASSISSGSLFSVSTGLLKVALFDFLHETTRSSKACSLFRLTSTGTLVLEGCSICVDGTNAAENALEESLIVLEGGSTRIERTRMGPLWLSSRAAIRFSSECMVSVANTSVCGAGRQSGSGGGIEGVVGTGKRVEIEGGEVSGCSSRSGNGGGVAVRMQGGSLFRMVRTRDEGSGSSFAGCTSQAGGGSGGLGGGMYLEAEERAVPDIEIRGAVFSRCVAVHGSNIFVKGDDLSAIVRKDLIELDDGAVEAGLAEGYERSTTNDGLEIPLVSYLLTFTPPAYVAGVGGHDYTGCGHQSNPCSSIEYVLPLRFGNRAGELCLTESFVIYHAIAIDEHPIAFSAEQAGMQVRISEDIRGAGESIISSSKDCLFCGMCFVMPQRMSVPLESVLRCNDMELVLAECGFGTEGGTFVMALAVVVKGCLKMQKLELNGLTFSTRAAFEIKGSGSSCICEELNWTDITIESTNSAVKVSDGASLEISNSVVDGTIEKTSSVIEVLGGATLNVRSTTLARIERQKGSGGAVLGRTGGGKATSVQNTTFEECVCREEGRMEGGGMWMEVENRGTLTFGNNTVKGCSVDERRGAGGGIYLKLGESVVGYSMKQNPRDMITSQQWEGSVRKEEEGENKWVVDREVEPGISVSVLHYLFPPKINIAYVKSGGSSDEMCGDDVEPCGDLMFGFWKMRTDQTTVHIVDSCTLNALLDRNGQSVTIRGESSEGGSLFEVESNGGFVLAKRDSSASLMLEHLQFSLPTESFVGQMIRIEGGKLFVDECVFGGGGAGRSTTDMWIVKSSEGALQMTKTSILEISFSGEGGIVWMKGGILVVEEGDWTRMEGNEPLINITDCEKVEVRGNSIVDECKTKAKEGGFLRCTLTAGGKVKVANSTIRNSGTRAAGGKGGGVYLCFREGLVSNYLFENTTFGGNQATYGRDVFIVCDNLNVTVDLSKFAMVLATAEGERTADMMGCDRNHFREAAHDLYLFLVQYEAPAIVVSPSGYDMVGCGSESYPCCSLWRGLRNIQTDAVRKSLTIKSEALVDHWHELTSFSVASADEASKCTVGVCAAILGRVSEAVLLNKGNLRLERIGFSLPLLFTSGQAGLLQSASSQEEGLTLSNCSFSFVFPSSSSSLTMNAECTYYLIHSNGGTVWMSLCSFEPQKFGAVPLAIASGFSATRCQFMGVEAASSMEGGCVACHLSAGQVLLVEGCVMDSCKCSEASGRGGFLFVDSVLADGTQPLKFKDATFDNNKAFAGKSLFVKAKALNTTITGAAFEFNYSGLSSDGNVFAGTDSQFENTDLFRFLIRFLSSTIFVSSAGSDVMRCGSEDDPCRTFWKGLSHLEENIEAKKVYLVGSLAVEDECDLSNCSVGAAPSGSGEAARALLVLQKPGGAGLSEGLFANWWSLSFTGVDLFLDGTLEDASGVVIWSHGGSLTVEGCSLAASSSAHFSGMTFVAVHGGLMALTDFEAVGLNFERALVEVWGGCSCAMNGVDLANVTANEGIVSYADGAGARAGGNEVPSVEINGSSFRRVMSWYNGSSVFTDTSASVLVMKINSSVFDMSRSEMSEAGGVMMYVLGANCRYEMNNNKITNCLCSPKAGRGGGVYMKAEGQGALDFVFKKCEFKGNGAWKGRDIFVECKKIAEQINETQFVLDLRPEVYNRFDAIYGIDEENYVPVDLIEYVTIYQQSTIVVSSAEEKNGTKGRQCGKVEQPCVTVGCGLEHLIIDFGSRLLVDVESEIERECEIGGMEMKSISREMANVTFRTILSKTREWVVSVGDDVAFEGLCFILPADYRAFHTVLFSTVSGRSSYNLCKFCGEAGSVFDSVILISDARSELSLEKILMKDLHCSRIMECEDGRLVMFDAKLENVNTSKSAIFLKSMCGSVEKLTASNSTACCGSLFEIGYDVFETQAKINCESSFSTASAFEFEFSLVDLVNVTSLDSSSFFECRSKWSRLGMNNCTVSSSSSGGKKLGSVFNVISLNGGDGLNARTSLWILNEGCKIYGIAAERPSPFFISKLHSVSTEEFGGKMKLTFNGELLLPCDLSFQIISRIGEVDMIEKYQFTESGFLSEKNVLGYIPFSMVASASEETEVSVSILFKNEFSSYSTEEIILKNRSKLQTNGEGRLVEGGEERKTFWPVIVIALVVVLLIVLIVSVVLAVRWRKQKRRTEELEIIVEDTVKKDPKAFEMVTMEMSPEEQWRRAEREAERKNEERIKKRIYETNIKHSESSEHLLSESGSTEYILGRDSDKIPEWMLEKVEEEETRKRTPSPSISSTSTTDTSDTESTFVRGEDLCPTTSSMSNLVDAMACSSPHEKLIVDLRDSLFMLLHGRNKTKEMAIGTLQEREQTAAQILFWVANLALHSFDEMENPLQSLSNLSPHIVLFSEHMVICIVMHSDLLSDDSDSSSISSSTVVTSASDNDDDSDSLPSSAFEDEEDSKNECMRWKAPELLNGTKSQGSKKTVVFSIGMMLWECVTLKIPFGEYEAVVAGQKILNGERPNCSKVSSSYDEVILAALSEDKKARPTLIGMKREFFQHFPSGTVIFTVSDAITYDEDSNLNVSELRRLASCSRSNL
ncbi:uncharacterized protein MONOS_587 [Monocercomonoides exilis]|uniref:uncharacterized protein n=1 Tax=Monocercomonoides exilis TaxID=2049356 RepID=UPI00355A1486|nr:hypothetical protein MONOS_587 [Monocercomonoides exilis]|eukprot:MONOS_587.1-p1 / transcript=MONOS_587.1 / gene=MONOS_587 / organism=Monocercomonoides_exilis_PA203 / gene_product=unspecified product / transcript_product=unspecified product / location=Mono_scaffold00009:194881-203252(+) / protein_length=2667 / sequence_SO=supercontig / SO=protein_coding / is_pseudo=false